jgi:hypothetical protein
VRQRHSAVTLEPWPKDGITAHRRSYMPRLPPVPRTIATIARNALPTLVLVLGAFRDLAGSGHSGSPAGASPSSKTTSGPLFRKLSHVPPERVCVHARSSVKRSTHAAADIPIPRTGTQPGGVDPCRAPQPSEPLLSPRDTKGARAAAITHVYRFPSLGECRHLFDKRIAHKLDGVRPVVRHRRVGEGTPARPVRQRRAAASLGVGQTALPRR